MMALQLDRAARDMSGAVDELLRRSAARQGRGRRVLHGWRSRPRARHCSGPTPSPRACPSTGSSRGPTRSRTTRRLTRRGPRPHRRARRVLRAPRRHGALEQQLKDLGKDVEFHVYDGRRPCVLQRHPTRGPRCARRRPRPGSRTIDFLHAHLAVSPRSGDPTGAVGRYSISVCASVATSTAWSTPTTVRRPGRARAGAGAVGPPPTAGGRGPRSPRLARRRRSSPPTAPAERTGDDVERPRHRRPPTLAAGPGRGLARPRPARLAGEPVGYAEEVEACYGVRPTPVPEEELAAAHRRLAEALPGTGPLAERLIAWREAHVVAPDRLPVRHRLAGRGPARPHAIGSSDFPTASTSISSSVTRQAVVGFQHLSGRPPLAWWPSTPTCPCCRSSLAHLVAARGLPGPPHRAHPQGGGPGPPPTMAGGDASSWWARPSACSAEGLADLGLEIVLGPPPGAAWSPAHLRAARASATTPR